MEITIILQWLAAWSLLLLAQSIFINGVYQSATGETKKRVDGSDEDSEMILYPLKKFFEKTKVVYYKYKGQQFQKLIEEIRLITPGFIFESEICNNTYPYFNTIFIELGKPFEQFYTIEKEILKKLGAKAIRDEIIIPIKVKNIAAFRFVKPEDKYIYPVWLRKPIIQCIKCMSSFWGALTFWPVVLFLLGFNWLEIPVFFADMFSLTYINWILYKKAQ